MLWPTKVEPDDVVANQGLSLGEELTHAIIVMRPVQLTFVHPAEDVDFGGLF
jgi:hypothetical protein